MCIHTSASVVRPVGTAVLLAGLVVTAASAGNKSWNSADGDWSAAGSWLPFGLPGPADAVFVGNTGNAENGTVLVDVNANVGDLTITDGMQVKLDGSGHLIANDVLVSGRNTIGLFTWPSRLRVEPTAFIFDCLTDEIAVTDDACLAVEPGAVLNVADLLILDSTSSLFGAGTITLGGNGPRCAQLDSGLQARVEGLTLIQTGDGLIDLDGVVQGDRWINVAGSRDDGSAFAHLTIEGTALHDPMDDDIVMSANNVLAMNLEEPWRLNPGATLHVGGNFSYPGPAIVSGAPFEVDGTVAISGGSAELQIAAPVTFTPFAMIEVGIGGEARFSNSATVQGGSFSIGNGGSILFEGTTTMQGGTFETTGGFVSFLGSTSWNGDVTFEESARQFGDASVNGATVITADEFDLDGFGFSTWSIGNPLTVNAAGIDIGHNTFDGTLLLSGTFLGRLTVNLDDPGESWTMAGAMNLGGVGTLMITRLEGSPVALLGSTTVTNRAAVTADCHVLPGADLTLDGPASILRLAGDSSVASTAQILGDGVLQTGAAGTLTLEPGLDMSDAGLENLGTLEFGPSVGLVVTDRFATAEDATWRVRLGGPTAGLDHDLLAVTDGPVELDGALEVEMVDLGPGYYEPQIGETFTILSGPGNVSGGFDNQPISFAPGVAYLWSVTVTAAAVFLELEEIVPCPADLSGDGAVDGADLGILLAAWGPCDECLADLNLDGAVDGADLGVLLASWGPCPL